MPRLSSFVAPVLVLVVLAGAYWYLALRDTPSAQTSAVAGPRGAVVEATEAIRATSVRKLKATGTLASNQSVTIRPEIGGRLAQIRFVNGQEVEAGQLLLSLDNSVQRAELADAEAKLELAQRDYRRADDLVKRGTVAQSRRDETLAALRSSEARVQLARAILAKMDVHAPFDGILGLRDYDVGAFLAAGDPVVNLEQVVPIKVAFEVPERFLTDLTVGKEIILRSDAFAGEQFVAHISAIDPLINPRTRSLRIEALAANEDRRLRPGQFVSVTLRVDERRDAIFVPEQAIVPNVDEPFVYRVVDNVAHVVPVQIGARIALHVEIRSGLHGGEIVVTAGQQRLSNGTPVKVIEPTFVASSPADEEIQRSRLRRCQKYSRQRVENFQ